MLLEDYLKKTGLNTVTFGMQCDVCHATLWNFLHGKTDIKLFTAAKIVKASGNEITFDDLIQQRKKSLEYEHREGQKRVKSFLVDLNKLKT